MKTWGMIKELTENPHKKFVAKYFKDEYFAYTRESMHCEEETYYDAIVLETEGEVWPLVVDEFTKGLEWEEVKEPVSFMEAFNALQRDKKNIYCILNGKKHIYKEDTKGIFRFREDCIADGDWYIED